MSIIDSYLKTGFRNLSKYRFYSFINILGLAIGIAGSLLIVLYVSNELSYDKFNKDYEQIYRIVLKGQVKGEPVNMAVSCAPMARALKNEIPDVESTARISRMGDWLIGSGDRKFNEEEFLFTDSSFFEMFSYKLLKGDPKKVLSRPRTMVMTQTAVRKYFGNEDPIGKSIRVENDTTLFEITGIMEDVPINSHFHFLLLGSLNSYPRQSENPIWLSNNFYNYVKLKKGTDPKEFQQKLRNLVVKYIGPQLKQILNLSIEDFEKSGNSYGYFIQPLKDIHLTSKLTGELETNGNILYVYIFSVVAILILLIACINFMNLATARSATRAKEVGLRKVVGSGKNRLIFQFLSESILVSFLALILGLLIVELALPAFNNLLEIKLTMGYFAKWYILPGLISFSLIVGLISGLYPSLFLAAFNPINVLKGKVKAGAKSGMLRKILVVSQFTVSISILLATAVLYQQLRYVQNYNLGFSKENRLVIKRSDGLKKNMDIFKQEALKVPGVISIANSNAMPGKNFSLNGFLLENDANTGTTYTIQQAFVSPGLEKTLGLQLVEGRFLSSDIPTDSNAVIISQSTVKVLELKDPLNHRLMSPGQPPRYWQIVGVVKDFHIESLRSNISPVALTFMPGNFEGIVIANIEPGREQSAINGMKDIWTKLSEFPFEYYFLDDSLNKMYKGEQRTGIILISFSILAIIISCLGLLGMVSFITSLRTKEIAIRKTLGAEETSIISILSSETLLLIVFSTVFAWIISWFALNKWLQNFAYHTKISPYLFFVVPIIITIISFITISFEVIKATRRNPADVLKYE
ncbi:MAG: FtsX-like permease family protein [Bacteroidales bacterium]|nr:FtsX-like permease family protein [Bacteroidales bacterium]